MVSQEEQNAFEKLRLMDDDFLSLVFDRNIEATEFLLHVILQRDDLNVIEVIGQRDYKNPVVGGRSIRIDIYAKDADGYIYDIEIQRSDEGADSHRARFHSGMIDTRMLKAGQDFSELKDSYIIFITERDVLGSGLPLYHIEKKIIETGADFNDGSHIIYVNGAYKNDNDPIGKLMHDFRCVDAVDMFNPILAEQVRFYKETEGGREIVCRTFEELADKRAQEAAEEKRIDTLTTSIKNLMTNLKLTFEQATQVLGVSEGDKSIIAKRF
jgi:hypothetical protein